ncbi:hypothetical protein GQ53DRAFT_292152 [Thozetella sp. PMI_491]|nr:hypothetical protein GQ53DRAFT_292152 [Thozetella sp. PMI_491]
MQKHVNRAVVTMLRGFWTVSDAGRRRGGGKLMPREKPQLWAQRPSRGRNRELSPTNFNPRTACSGAHMGDDPGLEAARANGAMGRKRASTFEPATWCQLPQRHSSRYDLLRLLPTSGSSSVARPIFDILLLVGAWSMTSLHRDSMGLVHV